jgi:hypothetical protein
LTYGQLFAYSAPLLLLLVLLLLSLQALLLLQRAHCNGTAVVAAVTKVMQSPQRSAAAIVASADAYQRHFAGGTRHTFLLVLKLYSHYSAQVRTALCCYCSAVVSYHSTNHQQVAAKQSGSTSLLLLLLLYAPHRTRVPVNSERHCTAQVNTAACTNCCCCYCCLCSALISRA